MKLTFPVYITLDSPDAATARRKLEGILNSELLVLIEWEIRNPMPAALTETKSADSFAVRGPKTSR